MPNYVRNFTPGGTYFFTVKTEGNAPIFCENENAKLLGVVFREMQQRWPVQIDAMVLLPDHLHAIWSLSSGDTGYPKRWAWLKKEFSKRYVFMEGKEQFQSESRHRNRRLGVWQRRYWEHTIQNENEYKAYFDYIHWNPVKHGLVNSPGEWQHSTFGRWVEKGVYPRHWGASEVFPGKVQPLNTGE